jgi:phosphatidylethanolamine/phosphatidyl-N-methylethanolamine N-methyltransferase
VQLISKQNKHVHLALLGIRSTKFMNADKIAVTVKSSLSNVDVENAYARWAPFYDWVFTLLIRPGRKAAAQAINLVGGRVLDVGIGTGLELPMFDPEIRLTGIDLSEPMLKIARKRVIQLGLKHVEDLCVMDALNLEFPDASFDAVVAPYVLTVVPNPQRMMDELLRVVKPGGEIVIVNHIAAERGPIAWIEGWLGKYADRLGWNPQFPWQIVGDWIAKHDDIELLERRTVAPISLFSLIRLRRK